MKYVMLCTLFLCASCAHMSQIGNEIHDGVKKTNQATQQFEQQYLYPVTDVVETVNPFNLMGMLKDLATLDPEEAKQKLYILRWFGVLLRPESLEYKYPVETNVVSELPDGVSVTEIDADSTTSNVQFVLDFIVARVQFEADLFIAVSHAVKGTEQDIAKNKENKHAVSMLEKMLKGQLQDKANALNRFDEAYQTAFVQARNALKFATENKDQKILALATTALEKIKSSREGLLSALDNIQYNK